MAQQVKAEPKRNVILDDIDRIELEKEQLRKNLSILDLLLPGRNADFTVWQKLFVFARPYVKKIVFCLVLSMLAAAALGPKLYLLNKGLKPVLDPEGVAREEAEEPSSILKLKEDVLGFAGLAGNEEPAAEEAEAPAGGETGGGAPAEDWDPDIARSKLLMIILLFLALTVVEQIIKYFQAVMIRSAGHRIIMDVRNALFAKVMSLSLNFHSKNHSGKLMSRITGDIAQFGAFFSMTAVELVESLTSFITAVVVLFFMSGGEMIIFAVVVCTIFLPVQFIGRQIRKRDRQVRRSVSVIYSRLSEALSGQKVIKAFSTEEAEFNKFRSIARETYRRTMKSARLRSRTIPVVELLGAFVVALLFWYGGLKVIDKTSGLEFNTLVTQAVALWAAIGHSRRLAKCHNNIASALASADRVGTLLYSDPEITDSPGAVDLKAFEKDLRFEDVSYEYEPGVPVLRNISFTVEKGKIFALVGPSGAGKTTLVDLIPRFYDVVSGRITIDGRDIRDYTIASLRRHIGIVTQETFLFSDTVRMNISYGSADASDEEIAAAARAANAHEFITDMEHGYNTQIGERGVLLSGGQRQRIAIARAVLKNPPILILDEATSSLDSKSEALVQEALFRLMAGRTTLVIAHRLSTIRQADRILVFDAARLAEVGTHEELLQQDGLYARLHELQTRWPGADERAAGAARLDGADGADGAAGRGAAPAPAQGLLSAVRRLPSEGMT